MDKELLEELEVAKEGFIKFYRYPYSEVKQGERKSKIPTKKMPVFYNKDMIINRDLSLIAAEAFLNLQQFSEEIRLFDIMTASGIRALRWLKELPENVLVYANDINPNALDLIQEQIRLNEMEKETARLRLSNQDANLFCLTQARKKEYGTIIDIDPFGSPNNFIDAVMQAVKIGGMLCVTATDTAVLFGVRETACFKKYGIIPLHNLFLKEVGTRLLITFLMRIAHQQEFMITPLLSFSAKHFVRVFIRIDRKKHGREANLKHLGFISSCLHCHFRHVVQGYRIEPEKFITYCPNCSNTLRTTGPIWIGALHSKEFVQEMLRVLATKKKTQFKTLARCAKNLKFIEQSLGFPVGYYSLHVICDYLQLPVLSFERFEKVIRDAGYSFARTHFDYRSFKSDIEIQDLLKLLKEKIKK